MSGRTFVRASAVAGAFVFLFALALVVKPGGEHGTRAIDDIGTLLAALAATGGAGFAFFRGSREHRATWLLLTLGLASWSAGEFIWACYELGSRGSVPFPSAADIGYLLAVPFVAGAVLVWPSGGGVVSRTRALLDGMVLAGSLLVVSWETVLGAVYRSGSDSLLSQVISLAYPLGDIVIVSVVVGTLIRTRRRPSSVLVLLASGMVAMAVADSVYAWLTATNRYSTGNQIDTLWVLAYALMGLAAIRRPNRVLHTTPPDSRSVRVAQIAVPYAFASVALTMVVGWELFVGHIGPFLFWAGAGLTGVIMTRQLLTLLDNRSLTGELQQKVEQLGARERDLARLAFHDPLTNLANRQLFRDRLEHALHIRARRPAPLGVLFLDLDDFKTVNDSLGHNCGDQLLIAVAERLRAVTRDEDTAARLGGDEFGILVEDERTDSSSLEAMAARLLDAMRARFFLDGREVTVRMSIGVVLSADGSEDADELLRHADLAMYAAKARGKGTHVLFVPRMAEAAVERLDLRQALDDALDQDLIRVRYQPIVDLASGRICGVEALARWRDEIRGDIPPSVFVPLAEETGRIVELGRSILTRACRDGETWQAQAGSQEFILSVNLSAAQLSDANLVDDVRTALRQSGLKPERLMLEITESVLVRDTERALLRLRALRGLGVRLAIDDFGTGYSSLSYLPRLPVDVIKIDRTFVKDITIGPDGSTLAHTIIELCQRLSLDTIAEGVEHVAQADCLRAIGCRAAQGWLYAPALPPSEVPAPGTVLEPQPA